MQCGLVLGRARLEREEVGHIASEARAPLPAEGTNTRGKDLEIGGTEVGSSRARDNTAENESWFYGIVLWAKEQVRSLPDIATSVRTSVISLVAHFDRPTYR